MGRGPKWKREVIQDHKFDFIDVHSFTQHSALLWAGYLWVYIEMVKGLAVYVVDTQTAIFLLAFNKWASNVQPAIKLSISRWIFSGCIIFSFLLLAKDWWTARKIIRSRDISFAYTNVIANRYYSVRGGYAYYCLFDRLGDCRHAWDSIAFFVFFSFKGWKRLLLAEGPRQVLNAITLYSVAAQQNFTFDIHVYQNEFSTLQGVVLSFMLLTVSIWCLSAIRLALAGLLYWPLLVCHIRGNLKEYCCHKVDKRISQLLADRRRKRFEKPKNAVVAGDVPDLKGDLPTLPKVELVGDGESVLSMPLYALSRTESTDSSRYLLSRTNTQVTDRSALSRKDSDSRPLLLRSDTQESNGVGARRQPTLPHLVGDFSIPEIPKPPMSAKMTPSPPKIDTRVPQRQSPPSVTSASARSMTTALSARTDPGPSIPGNPPVQGFTRRPSEPMQARRPSHFREDLGPQRQNSGPRTAPADPYQTPFPPRQNGFQEQQSQVRGGYLQQQAPPVTNPYGQTPRRPERPYPANGNGGAAGARGYNAGYPRFDGGYQRT